MLDTSHFDFNLDPARIAQTPCEPRDASRLLVVHRGRLGPGGETPAGSLEHQRFRDLPQFLAAGDTLVVNQSRVIPARLFGERIPTGGKVEILLVRREPESAAGQGTGDAHLSPTVRWLCLTHARAHLKPGDPIRLASPGTQEPPVLATLVERRGPDGDVIEFALGPEPFDLWLRQAGQMPLPPYIHRGATGSRKTAGSLSSVEQRRLAELDAVRYQTVYARADGSVAAPTAGLHFTAELLEAIRARGVRIADLQLHVGPGTFRPVKTEKLAEHIMHEEVYEIPDACVEAIRAARQGGGRVIAVGTTTLRALESACAVAAQAVDGGANLPTLPQAGPGRTRLFVHPPWRFRCVDALVTNFHLPKSTLLMLVAAFATPGRETGVAAVQAAYQCAIQNEYRFFSYGDAMLLI